MALKIKVKKIKMIEKFEWIPKYITGNELLDNQHKSLFDLINEIYEMFSDTKVYHEQILEAADKLKAALTEHCYTENDLFLRYKITDVEDHIEAHRAIIESMNDIENHNLTPLIYSMLLCDTIIGYFLYHFPNYDVRFINELNAKIASGFDEFVS